jgi:uncharacterized membrane protein YhaH (DUF805 family)
MDPLALLLSSSGRLSPRPFLVALLIVYAAGFLSQALLAAPVLERTGLWSFAIVQAAVMWMWFAVHAKRLHDAGRSVGPAVGIAIVCSLAVLLLMLVLAVFQQAATQEPNVASGFIGLVAFLYLLAIISGNTDFGVIGIVLAVFAGLAATPFLLAFGFSIWAGTRPSVAASEPAHAAATGA